MIFKKFILILFLAIIASSCTINDPKPFFPENAITCVHKYEKEIKFTYLPENISRFIINDMTMFHIATIDDRNVFLNIYEIENYNCD
jgi:hypothetical protein